MQVGMIVGHTRVLGKSQGYRGLPIRDGETDGVPMMTSVWYPSPDEMAKIAAGAGILVTLLGSAHPPIIVITGEPPSSERPDDDQP